MNEVGFWKGRFRVFLSKNPGTRVGFRVFKNVPNWRFLALKNRQIGALWLKNSQISLEIIKLALFGPPNGNYKFFSELCLKLYQFLKKISILLQNVVFWTPFNMLLTVSSRGLKTLCKFERCKIFAKILHKSKKKFTQFFTHFAEFFADSFAKIFADFFAKFFAHIFTPFCTYVGTYLDIYDDTYDSTYVGTYINVKKICKMMCKNICKNFCKKICKNFCKRICKHFCKIRCKIIYTKFAPYLQLQILHFGLHLRPREETVT